VIAGPCESRGMPWRYAFKPETVTVLPEIREPVVELARTDRVRAVRLLREETGLPLAVAVRLVGHWCASEVSG
jgi:hypothetical protein